jgi:GAF domain-containing protein
VAANKFKKFATENPITPGRGTITGRTALGGKTVHVADVLADRDFVSDCQSRVNYRSALGVPLLRRGETIGVFTLTRSNVQPYTASQIELVENFAAQAVIAIENARLLNELRQRTNDLTESLEQQTATLEVLGVISRSKFELQPILQSVVDTASQLCRADPHSPKL